MTDLLLAVLHLAVMTAKLCGPGGVRAVIAENLLLKQQLIVLRRARQRAPNLTLSDRLLCGFWWLFLSPGRFRKVAIVELKSRNPRFGCPRIARIISHTFGVDIDKNVVSRVLSKHYRPVTG